MAGVFESSDGSIGSLRYMEIWLAFGGVLRYRSKGRILGYF